MSVAVDLLPVSQKVNVASPGLAATALNNFVGKDSIEQGARNPVRVAFEENGSTRTFSKPSGPIPW